MKARPVTTLSRNLTDAPTARLASTAGTAIPGADSQPSAAGFVTLLAAFKASGGTTPADMLGRLLLDHQAGSPASLADWIEQGRLMALGWRCNTWVPMFQLKASDLAIKPGVEQVRAQLPALWTPWATAAWFAQPNPRLAGQAPVDLIDLDLRSVYNAARSWRPDDGRQLATAPRPMPALPPAGVAQSRSFAAD